MMVKLARMILQIIFYIFIIVSCALAAGRLVTELHSSGKLFYIEDSPSSPVAVVFGAGLMRDGSPTAVLQDRVSTAARLYKAGKVNKILMSGDNRRIDYNEPRSMQELAVSLGVPEEDIILDYAGLRTYDTCYRARDIFGLSEAILITQRFHLPRAVFTCNSLGIKAVGVIADQRQYTTTSYGYWKLRETLASLIALLDIWVFKPLPILGEKEFIFPVTCTDSLHPWEKS